MQVGLSAKALGATVEARKAIASLNFRPFMNASRHRTYCPNKFGFFNSSNALVTISSGHVNKTFSETRKEKFLTADYGRRASLAPITTYSSKLSQTYRRPCHYTNEKPISESGIVPQSINSFMGMRGIGFDRRFHAFLLLRFVRGYLPMHLTGNHFVL